MGREGECEGTHVRVWVWGKDTCDVATVQDRSAKVVEGASFLIAAWPSEGSRPGYGRVRWRAAIIAVIKKPTVNSQRTRVNARRQFPTDTAMSNRRMDSVRRGSNGPQTWFSASAPTLHSMRPLGAARDELARRVPSTGPSD
jgi:hypothetical protein